MKNPLKLLPLKKMRRRYKREEAKREVKRLRENLYAMLTSEDINRVAIIRIGEIQAKSKQVYEAANDQYNEAMIEEVHLRNRKNGKEAQKEIQERINNFIESGRKDVRKRQEFSS
jgi:predicted secreted protein